MTLDIKKLWSSKYITAATIVAACAAAVLKELGVLGIHWHFLGEAATVVLAAEKLLAAKPQSVEEIVQDLLANKTVTVDAQGKVTAVKPATT